MNRERGGLIDGEFRRSDSARTAELIQDARGGSVEAFDELARLFLPRVRRWALGRTGNEDDADDVVQQTFLKAYRNIDRFRGEASFSTWLYQITSNAANELFRRRSTRDHALDGFRISRHPSEDVVEPDAGGGSGIERVVRAFLGDLSERQREVMDLVDLQGYKPQEVAEMTGMNPNTVRAHLLRARRTIRSLILESRALPEEVG